MIRHNIIRLAIILIAIGVKPAYAEDDLECSAERNDSRETRWTCTCELYSDRRGSTGCSHLNYEYMECSMETKCSSHGGIFPWQRKYKGQWSGMVRFGNDVDLPTRVVAEMRANDVCENATDGVDCRHCACGNPR